MKVNGGGPHLPVDAAKASKANDVQKEEIKSKGTKVVDSVDARLSKALKAVEEEIYSTGLTAGEVHSNVDEKRIVNLLKSMENVEAKGPSLGDEDIMAMVDSLSVKLQEDPEQALKSHHRLDGSRVLELTEAI